MRVEGKPELLKGREMCAMLKVMRHAGNMGQFNNL